MGFGFGLGGSGPADDATVGKGPAEELDDMPLCFERHGAVYKGPVEAFDDISSQSLSRKRHGGVDPPEAVSPVSSPRWRLQGGNSFSKRTIAGSNPTLFAPASSNPLELLHKSTPP